MFKREDRSKLLRYLAKKPVVEVSVSVDEKKKKKGDNVAGRKASHAMRAQQLSPAAPAKSDDDVSGKVTKPRGAKKSSKGSRSRPLHASPADDDQIEVAAEEVPSTTASASLKRSSVRQSTPSKVAKSSSGQGDKGVSAEKRRLEQSLSRDVAKLIAHYQDNGIGDEEELNDDEEDEVALSDLEEVYEEDGDDDQVTSVGPLKTKKQAKNRSDAVPEEISRRSNELGAKARQTLAASMFRSLNESLYTADSGETRKTFTVSKFRLYHEAYEKLMADWPLKPIDYLIDVLKQRIKASNLPKTVIADVGCGSQPRLALAFPTATVYSYDLHQADPAESRIISADMSRLPLDSGVVDYAVYSLSLMATNLRDILREANRILKPAGHLLLVEVASRFADYQTVSGNRLLGEEKYTGHRFAVDLKSYGLKVTGNADLKPNGYFTYLEFKKVEEAEAMMPKSKAPPITLKPCLYKTR